MSIIDIIKYIFYNFRVLADHFCVGPSKRKGIMEVVSALRAVGKSLVFKTEGCHYAFLIAHVRAWSAGEVRFYFSPIIEFEEGDEEEESGDLEVRLIYAECRDDDQTREWVIYGRRYDAGTPVGPAFSWKTFPLADGMIE